MHYQPVDTYTIGCFSALQRAEIAEMSLARRAVATLRGFSALQRAEIAEIVSQQHGTLILF